MSITAINSRLFHSLSTLQRRAINVNSVGDSIEQWSNTETDIPSSIQPVSLKEIRELEQGKIYNVTNKAYLPAAMNSIPKQGDRLLEQVTNRLFDVQGVEKYTASRVDVTQGHHYKLYLLEINPDKT